MRTSSESSSTGRALPGQRENSRTPVSVTHTSNRYLFEGVLPFQTHLHISEWAGNVIFHPFQIVILEKMKKQRIKKRKHCHLLNSKETLAATLSDLSSSTMNSLQPNSENMSRVTHWVWFRLLHWAIGFTFRHSQLHPISWKKENRYFELKENLELWSFLQHCGFLWRPTVPKFEVAINSSISSSSESSMRGVKAYLLG